MKTIVVVPTNRPERIRDFIIQWGPHWWPHHEVTLLIIEDSPKPKITKTDLSHYMGIFHYSHQNIDADLGEKGRCIARFAPAVRSYGIWKATQFEPDMIWTTDDDCLPSEHDPIAEHWQMLETPRILDWWKNAPDYMRGFPYMIRDGAKPVLNHGLVEGVPDIDSVTQLMYPHLRYPVLEENEHVPRGAYFPMAIQNVAFRPELAPIMYLPLLPEGTKRWSDIWCGVVMKRICDERGWPVTNGYPCVKHERASNVWSNLKQEWMGFELHERLWKVVDRVPIGGTDLLEDYSRIAQRILREMPELNMMAKSMLDWVEVWR